jgi:hypothetical protein
VESHPFSSEPVIELAKEFRRFRETVVQDALAAALGEPDGAHAGVTEIAREDVSGELLNWLSFDQKAAGTLVAFLLIEKSARPLPPVFWKTPQGKRALVLGVASVYERNASSAAAVMISREQIRVFEDWYETARRLGGPLLPIHEPRNASVGLDNDGPTSQSRLLAPSFAQIKAKTAICAERLGHRKAVKLLESVKKEFPGRHLPRTLVRKAIKELWGNPQIGAPPKSPK